MVKAVPMRAGTRRCLAVLVVALSALAFFATPQWASATTSSAGSLAAANVGKTAGSCAVHPSTNTLGGSQFESSCTGVADGLPEYWCADFVKWVWRNSGLNVSGLTPAAESFRTYGQNYGTFHSAEQVGDAITFSSVRGGRANHVGIVTALNADGSVVVANGDWGGVGGQGMHYFAETSKTVSVTIPASVTSTGSYVSAMSYYITAIIGASGSGGGSGPPPGGGDPYTPSGLCGSSYGVVDSHRLSGATVFLLYDNGSGNNCVVTLADSDTGAVSMNATLAVQGGSSGSNPGSFHWYAGPVSEHAPNSCVQWGGTYGGSSWTSGWSHCGTSGGTPPPGEVNPNTPEGVCGTGYSVVDQHELSGATVYLLYNASNGYNCVTTLANDISGAASMNATLSVQGGSSASNPGTFTYYAGPVKLSAPSSCVQWGGTYRGSSWTSAWSHCGSGSSGSQSNPYTAAGVCGAGYSVIDSHNLGSATIYLLYKAGYNCVTTLVHTGGDSVGLNATLSVQGGSSASNPGLFEWYAGPVKLSAASSCVSWGGSYESTSWTSGWSHCG
jgi:hypothetical protein